MDLIDRNLEILESLETVYKYYINSKSDPITADYLRNGGVDIEKELSRLKIEMEIVRAECSSSCIRYIELDDGKLLSISANEYDITKNYKDVENNFIA